MFSIHFLRREAETRTRSPKPSRHVTTKNWVLWSLLFFVAAGVLLLKRYDSAEPVNIRQMDAASEPTSASKTPPTFMANKMSCLQSSEWRWREYESLAWCERHRVCGQAVPECPGGNEQWVNIRDNSRICETTKAGGYRVYCHPKEASPADSG